MSDPTTDANKTMPADPAKLIEEAKDVAGKLAALVLVMLEKHGGVSDQAVLAERARRCVDSLSVALAASEEENKRLRGELERIATGDRGDWSCSCPSGDIAAAALAKGTQP